MLHRPPKDRCWAYAEITINSLIEDNRIWFGKTGKSKPRLKKFLSEIDGVSAWTWWSNTEVGHNQEATKELKGIFTENKYFETPKPTRLIDRILKLATNKNDLILDSFAGSGTTAHAVQNLNAQDGGERRFLLIEMEDYAETITAERVRRVMSGYGTDKKAVPGTGGAFDYYTLGPALFDEKDLLNPSVSTEAIRSYVWHSETRAAYPAPSAEEPYLLGLHEGVAYYFAYEPDSVVTLNFELLRTFTTSADQYLIYADNCLLSDDFLAERNIIFKKIPRDINRL